MGTSSDPTNQNINALSWNIATNPQLYRDLALNPYSLKASELWLEKFPISSTADIVLAVILAEPEGGYDKNFKQLETNEQALQLHKQNTHTNERIKHLNEYVSLNKIKLTELSQDLMFDELSKAVFEAADFREIEQKFSQKQRIEIKLLIARLIEEIEASKLIYEIPRLRLLTPPVKKSGKVFVSKHTLLIIVCAAPSLLFISFLTAGFLEKKPVEVQVPQQAFAVQTQIQEEGFPARLEIPAIHVDSEIESMGIDDKGEMQVPSSTSSAGWYQLGPKPGEAGSAVISGHFDGKNGKAGVFSKLDKLKPGDKMFIADDAGKITIFVVRETRTYKPGYAEEVFLPNDGGTHLNLVTCDGVWDKSEKSYTKRLVVFADIL